MEKLVLTGTVCFCVGLTVGLILGAVVMALAVAAKKYKPKTEEIDDCWGCFGAAMATVKREENAELNDRNHRLIQVIRNIVDIAGFEIVGRVTLKHKKSGKVFH